MVQFSRLLVLSLVTVMLVAQIHPAACKSKTGFTSSANEGKGKSQNKKRKKKSSAPISTSSRLYASEEPNRSANTNPPASQKKSPTPTLAPSQLFSDEKTNSPSSNDLQSSRSPSADPVGTPASSSNRSSNRSNVTVTPSPSFVDSFLEEEVPTIAPIEASASNDSAPTVSPSFPLPTVDQSQQIIEDPTAEVSTATGRLEKSFIMLVSLVSLFGGMVAIVVWQVNNRYRRSWEGVSDAPLV